MIGSLFLPRWYQSISDQRHKYLQSIYLVEAFGIIRIFGSFPRIIVKLMDFDILANWKEQAGGIHRNIHNTRFPHFLLIFNFLSLPVSQACDKP